MSQDAQALSTSSAFVVPSGGPNLVSRLCGSCRPWGPHLDAAGALDVGQPRTACQAQGLCQRLRLRAWMLICEDGCGYGDGDGDGGVPSPRGAHLPSPAPRALVERRVRHPVLVGVWFPFPASSDREKCLVLGTAGAPQRALSPERTVTPAPSGTPPAGRVQPDGRTSEGLGTSRGLSWAGGWLRGAATWAAASLVGPSVGPLIRGLQGSHVGRGPRGCGNAKCLPRAGQSGKG